MSETFVNLFRIRQSDHGTEGILSIGGFTCFTMELPWRDNEPNVSCIPPGRYDARIVVSPKFGKVYWVVAVPGRTHIRNHAGNLAGDTRKGFKTHSYGCILSGKYKGYIAGQRAILLSRVTIRKFINLLQGRPLKLNIIEAF